MMTASDNSADVVAMILAGGEGSRLSALSQRRAKPAVPFGGIYRIIDFTMTNLMRSRIAIVGICTQYKPYSLMDHVSVGEAWGYGRRGRVAKILPPYTGEADSDWYAGTADAIYQNLGFIERYRPDLVLVLSGDHVYRMDYRPLIAFHREKGASLTVACQEVPLEETSKFGIIEVDRDDRIMAFKEKPDSPPRSRLANLGIYVFGGEVLARQLRADAADRRSSHDFGKDIIPRMVESHPCYAYRFSGYWRDVGTLQSYWRAHMDMLDERSGLDISRWGVCTASRSFGDGCLMPAHVAVGGRVEQSVVSWGCSIEGTVRRSVLSPCVEVGQGAIVEESVLLTGVKIGRGCVVRRAIIDKYSKIGDGATVGLVDGEKGGNPAGPVITLVGKQARLPNRYAVPPGCVIPFAARPRDLHGFPTGRPRPPGHPSPERLEA